MDKLSLSDHNEKIGYIESTIASCINDLNQSFSGRLPIYNIDFSLICPLLFEKPVEGSKEYLVSSKDLMNRILDSDGFDGVCHIAISGATYYEFLDQLEHTRHCIQTKLPRIINRNIESILNDNDFLMKSDNIRDSLLVLSKKGYKTRIKEPIQKLRILIEKNAINGLGDFLEPPSKKDIEKIRPLYEQILRDQTTFRLRKDHSRREDDDSVFHYKMDTANICLSFLYAKERSCVPLFTSPSGMNIQFCTDKDNRMGRNPAVPLFLKNAIWLKKNNLIPDAKEYLEDAMNEINDINMKLGKYKDIDNPYLRKKVFQFYKTYGLPLYKGAIKRGINYREDYFDEEIIAEIRDRVGNEKATLATIESAIEDLKTGAKELDDLAHLFDTSYFDPFGLNDDPIVKRIKNNLRL